MVILLMVKYLFISYVCITMCENMANAKTFLINTPLLKSHKTPEVTLAFSRITEAFNILNINVEYRYRPNKRSLIEANDGVVDGEFARIKSMTEQYQNLVVVPEYLIATNLVAFSLKPTLDLSDYKLGSHNYRIGYMSGWKNATDLLEQYTNSIGVRDYEVLFKLLESRRVDLVIFTKDGGEKILKEMQLADYQVSPSLLSYKVYLLLHKKHAALAPLLADKLKVAKRALIK